MASDSQKQTVFISWSKERSRQVATALRSWLPNVIQALDPWMSDQDLDIGSRWNTEVSRRLDQADFGIVCVTPENQLEPWLQFEAGALGKALERSMVCPYLVGLNHPDLRFPLAMFQAARANREETHRLVHTINRTLGTRSLQVEQLDQTFNLWWPELESKLLKIPVQAEVPAPQSDTEMLRELIGLVRFLIVDRSNPEERASEAIALIRALFQGLQSFGAPPMPPQLEEAMRTTMTAALKPAAERVEDILRTFRDT
jgi:hypothetical protein